MKQKNYDFDIADNIVKGNAQFTHIEFFCSVCKKQYTIKEIKENDAFIKHRK